jgi:fucose permease
MQHAQIKVSLLIKYLVFALMLNSVGTVKLQVQNTNGVSESAASVLEAFKDLPIAITSLLIASFITRIGYKRSMQIALAFIGVVCLAMPELPHFWMAKLLFAATGACFALIKVSVFATLGIVTQSRSQHVSLMNFLESFFMVGVLSGYFIFSAFVDDLNPGGSGWLHVYYLLAGLCACAFLLLAISPLDESTVHSDDARPLAGEFGAMLKLCAKPLVFVFVITAFLYVLIEQSIMSWLPSFNSSILHLPASLSIQMASILAASTALGRFLAGIVMRHFDWYRVLSTGLVLAALLVLLVLPLASQSGGTPVTSWANAPLAAFVFPMIGLCIAPIYPAINSLVLSALPARQHAPMAGLIVVFSALGGTSGSIITGNLFEHLGGQQAFYFSLLPISLLFIALYRFKGRTDAETSTPAPA